MALLPDIVLIRDLLRWFQSHCLSQRPGSSAHHPEDTQRENTKISGLQNQRFMEMTSTERILNGCVREKSFEGGDEAEVETVLRVDEATGVVELRV